MLTPEQLPTLKAAILAETDPAFVTARTNGQSSLMAGFYNQPSVSIVWRSTVQTAEVGSSVNYVAVESLTDINRAKVTTFYVMNPAAFVPRADIRTYWSNTFSGALGGQGQATRDALEALWRRAAKRGEALFITGAGTTLSPATLTFEGDITDADIGAALEA